MNPVTGAPVTLTRAELEALLQQAAERGARQLLDQLGLRNGHAAQDIRELRDLLAQYQGFADVQMGVGTLVLGLASVIMGQALVRTRSLGVSLTGAVMGSVLFRLLVSIALRWGLNPNDLKLITAFFVLLTLVLPGLLDRLRKGKGVRHA